MVPPQELAKLGEFQMQPCTEKVIAANGQTIKTTGMVKLKVTYQGARARLTFIVSPQVEYMLLSKQACMTLGILHKGFPSRINQTAQTQRIPTKEEIIAEFSDVFSTDAPLGTMHGKPMHISVKEGAIPFKVNGARPIPFAMRDEVKTELDRLVTLGVIAPVTEPTDWCHPMSVQRKPSGKLRMCVDLRMLNKYVKRPVYPLRAPKDVVSNVPPSAKYFSTFDATSGYWQVPLDKESQDLTVFITPWGRFKHLRSTMGLSSSGDEYCQRGDAALAGIKDMEKIVDDVLLYKSDLPAHIAQVKEFLLKCREAGITLNPEKFQFCKQEVKFAGYRVTKDGIKADPEKVKAIAEFPKPTNITDLRSFLGLVEQLAPFSKDTAGTMGPLRPLLSSRNVFHWDGEHDKAFEDTKKVLVSSPILSSYDPQLETTLYTDASSTKGLGYILTQKHADRHRLVECGSRFVTDTESRYAMVELELQAVVWAMKRCNLYLQGLDHFNLVVDHQPLVSILDKYTLDAVDNRRLQNLKSKLTLFNFTTKWQKGKDHKMADALSRSPVNDPSATDGLEPELAFTINHVFEADGYNKTKRDPLLEELRAAAKTDPVYKKVCDFIVSGFPEKPDGLDPEVRGFWKIRDDLSICDGLLLKSDKLVVPQATRKSVLQALHDSHQGIDRTRRRARQSVYWPGMNSDIQSTVEACSKCLEWRPSLPQEPMRADKPPGRAWEDTSADFFSLNGKDYLVYVDRYSGWIEVQLFKNPPTASSTTAAFQTWFGQHGIPVRIRTDGGKQFTAKLFQDFAQAWKFNHVVSSPHYPQSNGHAEAAVKSMKRLLAKHQHVNSPNFVKGLIELRNTPSIHGMSPAEACTGSRLRSMVPDVFQSGDAAHQTKLCDAQKKSALKYNETAQELPKLYKGDAVRVQDHVTRKFTVKGVIDDILGEREYSVKTKRGGTLVRNRRFIIPNKECPLETLEDIRTAEADPKVTEMVDFEETPEVRYIPRRSARRTKKPRKYSK